MSEQARERGLVVPSLHDVEQGMFLEARPPAGTHIQQAEANDLYEAEATLRGAP